MNFLITAKFESRCGMHLQPICLTYRFVDVEHVRVQLFDNYGGFRIYFSVMDERYFQRFRKEMFELFDVYEKHSVERGREWGCLTVSRAQFSFGVCAVLQESKGVYLPSPLQYESTATQPNLFPRGSNYWPAILYDHLEFYFPAHGYRNNQ